LLSTRRNFISSNWRTIKKPLCSTQDFRFWTISEEKDIFWSSQCILGTKETYHIIALRIGIWWETYSYKILTNANEFRTSWSLKKRNSKFAWQKLIRPSKSHWSCVAFYVNNAAEKEWGVPRLLINYKPLNKVLQWIRYPISNKRDFLNRLYNAKLISKFDMKSGFWQLHIAKQDRYKTALTVPFGHYEWNVMPFGLENAPSEFQNIMNDIFTPFSSFIIVYIDDFLIYSNSIDQHFKHLQTFLHLIEKNGLVVFASKMVLFQTKIRFLGHDIFQGTIKPI